MSFNTLKPTKYKSLLAIAVTTLSLTATAADFDKDGIYYNITSTQNKTVEVTGTQTYPATYKNRVTIPASVTYNGTTYSVTAIGAGAFIISESLQSVSIPGSVKEIKIGAFAGCTGLTAVTLPAGLTTIGEKCFEGCRSLTSIQVPASVTSIGEYAFRSCSGLTSITVESGNTTYDSRNNCNAIVHTASNQIIAACRNTTIPASVTSLGTAAFYGQTDLQTVAIPTTITSIGRRTFQGCTALKSIHIPASVATIEDYAFWGCTSLANVFTHTKQPSSLALHTFQGIADNCTLYVTNGTKTTYTAAGWNTEVFPGGITEFTPGDVNGDGEVDIMDATIIVYYMLGRTTNLNLTVADVNGDGGVDILDPTIIIYQHVLGRSANAAKTRPQALPDPQ